ncbi:hypothetical protein GW846_01905 [Candidatus Gracilibacteria bacterium]|nr:hypothetical protein [Candidatus Gracilibacteria bacterium]
MLAVYLGIYIFLLAILWGFFFVARHHALKFGGYSSNIAPVTNVLFIVMIVLSIVGAVMIFSLDLQNSFIELPTIDSSETPAQEVYY